MYWDSSALVPLMARETRTDAVLALVKRDPAASVWWATEVECASAIRRRARDESWGPDAEREARARMAVLVQGWFVVTPSGELRDRAVRLVRVHHLAAADALQLAAALSWAEDHPEGREFVSLDRRLSEAAAREGFEVLPAEGQPA